MITYGHDIHYRPLTCLFPPTKMPGVTEEQLKNKLKNLKQLFRAYREAISKTGNPHVKEPPFYEMLFELYGERPLDRSHTVSCGLAPAQEGASSHEGGCLLMRKWVNHFTLLLVQVPQNHMQREGM